MIIIMKILGMPLKVFTTLYHQTTKVSRKWFEIILSKTEISYRAFGPFFVKDSVQTYPSLLF